MIIIATILYYIVCIYVCTSKTRLTHANAYTHYLHIYNIIMFAILYIYINIL